MVVVVGNREKHIEEEEGYREKGGPRRMGDPRLYR